MNGAEPSTGRGVKFYSWEEIQQHNSKNDQWLVIEGKVYDATRWAKKHPGGAKVIQHYAGQNATDAFNAFHIEKKKVAKYLKPICIGNLDPTEHQIASIDQDFWDLRKIAEKMNLFSPSFLFYSLSILQVIVMEIIPLVALTFFGLRWETVILTLVALTISQAQAGWLQHDFGHLSVCKTSKYNHLVHYFLMGCIKGASCSWWNHMHFQHHAKPNVMNKDPDVRLEAIFVLGDQIPKEVAKKKDSFMPYNFQHKYFLIIGPPLLFPFFFQVMIFRHAITRKEWLDLAMMLSFYVRFLYCYVPFFGFFYIVPFYLSLRILDSMWFTWVAQTNHLPMEIDHDMKRPWLSLQMHATRNINKSPFNDWFTGHLNFQIEHHLFPTMPRHNLYKIQPYVISLCKKYNLNYQKVPLGQAMADIIRSLKKSGQIWKEAYREFHLIQ